MYRMLCGLVMDGHDPLTLTSLSLLYRFVNVLYFWTLFLLLNTYYNVWSRLVTLCDELLFILGMDLYTVSMLLVDATYHFQRFSRQITLGNHFGLLCQVKLLQIMLCQFLLLETFCHAWSYLISLLRITLYSRFWPVYRLCDPSWSNIAQFFSFSR
jgi:hypothetical protein